VYAVSYLLFHGNRIGAKSLLKISTIEQGAVDMCCCDPLEQMLKELKETIEPYREKDHEYYLKVLGEIEKIIKEWKGEKM